MNDTPAAPRGPAFSGWRMVVVAAALQFLQAGLLNQSFGAYVAVLSAEFGWSKTALAGGAALQSVEGALLGPLMGWSIDRFGPRLMVTVGVVCFGFGFVALSTIDSISGFYAAILLIALGASMCGYFPLTIAVAHWFRRRRARALASMGIGFALGGVLVPLVGWSMQVWGWRSTALVSGVLMLTLGLPLARMIRGSPSELGQSVDGMPEPSMASTSAHAQAPPHRDFTAAEALRTSSFWLLGAGHALALLVVTSVSVHAISHIHEGLGYTIPQASLVFALLTAAQVGGMMVGAAVGDRWDKRFISAGCMLGHMSGLLMLAYAANPVMLAAFAVLHGGAWGLRGPLMQAMRADYFGLQALGMIMGIAGFLTALGQVAGPLVAGAFADLYGNYRGGLTLLALLSGLGSVLFLLARKPSVPAARAIS